MHQIVLLTAMAATTGLFGGRHRGPVYYPQAPVYSAYAPGSTCQPGSPCAAAAAYAAPAYRAPAPQAPVATAPRTAYYPSYFAAPAAATCTTGTCPRR